jgi:hypothetical protein
MESSSALAKLIVAAASGGAGFAVAAAYLALEALSDGLGLFEGWSFVALFVAVPAVVVSLLPFPGRLFCFGLGMLAIVGTSFIDVAGADNAMMIFPLMAISFTVAAVVAEACVRAAERILSRRIAASSPSGSDL